MNHQSPPADGRLAKRLLWLAGLLGVLLIGVVVIAALHGDGLNPVTAAAERTAAMPGARIALEVSYSGEGEAGTIDGHGAGVYNARTGRSRTHLSLPVSGETITTYSVGDRRSVHLRGPSLAPALPPRTTGARSASLARRRSCGRAAETYSPKRSSGSPRRSPTQSR